MADPLLLASAGLLVVSTAYGTAVAATETHLRGEPFGLHIPGRVRTHLALGLGSAISAPWPMPAIATWAAVRATPGSRDGAAIVAGVGLALLAGTLGEPVTWRRRGASPMARATIPLHLATGSAMVMSSVHRLRHHTDARPA